LKTGRRAFHELGRRLRQRAACQARGCEIAGNRLAPQVLEMAAQRSGDLRAPEAFEQR